MKKVAKVFFVIGIIGIVVSIIYFGIGNSNRSKFEEMRNKSNIAYTEYKDYCEKYNEDRYNRNKYAEKRDKAYEEYKNYDKEYDRYFKEWRQADTVKIGTSVATVISIVIGIGLEVLSRIREKKGRDAFYKVLLGVGIFIIVAGAIGTIWLIYVVEEEIAVICSLLCGGIGGNIIWGYVTYKILNGKKYSFLWGFLLGIIGIIVSACMRNSNGINNRNKYEDLTKLQKLKEDGAITDVEFEEEKAKILK